MIILFSIALYLLIGVPLLMACGTRWRRVKPLPPPIARADRDEQLDIESALRRSSR